MNLFIDQDLCTSLVLSFGHFLWQGTLIAALTALLVRIARTARRRYQLLVLAFGLMGLAPLVTLVVQFRTPIRAVHLVESDQQSPLVTMNAGQQGTAQNHPEHQLGTTNPPTVPTSNRAAAARLSWERFSPLLIDVYLAGVAVMLLRVSVGLWGGWRLASQAVPIADPALVQLLRQRATSLGVKILPGLAYCEHVAVPTVIGIIRPTILLPFTVTSGLSLDQVEAVLTHELAHLKRYDHLVNLFQRLVESALFFHPAVWWMSNRIRIERELCCDDLVIQCGAAPVQYAESLLRVAELSRLSAVNAPASAVSLLATGQPSALRQRISRLLGTASENHVRFQHRWPAIFLAMLCLLVGWTTTRVGWSVEEPEEVARLIAKLPNNATIELAGVGYHKWRPNDWWAADGTRLTKMPSDSKLHQQPFGEITADNQEECREFIVRIAGLPEGEQKFGWQFLYDSSADAVHSAVMYKPTEFRIAEMPPISRLKLKTATLRICMDRDPDEVVRSFDTSGKKEGEAPSKAELRRIDDLIQPIRVEADGNQAVLIMKVIPREKVAPFTETPPEAIGKDGKRYGSIRAGGQDGFFSYLYRVPREQIVKFEYRFRLYRQWVTFSNISLHAGESSKAKVMVDTEKIAAVEQQESKYQSATYLQKSISAKIPESLWGKPVNGLRLAVVARDASNTDWNNLPADTMVPASLKVRLGDEIQTQLMVQNVGDEPANLTIYTYTEVDRRLDVKDQAGKSVGLDTLFLSIPALSTSWQLLPGERFLFQMPPLQLLKQGSNKKGIGYFAQASPGRYTLHCSYIFGPSGKDDPRPPRDPSEWAGTVTAAPLEINVSE